MTEARFLLDSNICISVLEDAGSPAAVRLGDLEPGEAVTSAIAYVEVLRGLSGPNRQAGALLAFFRLVPVLPFDDRAASEFASLPFQRARFDRLIAAHALSLGVTLVTNNERDFTDIEGLKVENWARL